MFVPQHSDALLDCLFRILNRFGVRSLAGDSQVCSPHQYAEPQSLRLKELFCLGCSTSKLVGGSVQSPQVRISETKCSSISEHIDRIHSALSNSCALFNYYFGSSIKYP